jgi:hypothetical protein
MSGLCRVENDATVVCWQGKIEQVYIKSKCVHSILLDTVNCWTQQCVVHSYMLHPLCFEHLSCLTISSVNYAKFWNLEPF